LLFVILNLAVMMVFDVFASLYITAAIRLATQYRKP